ncbi:hypothetical protein PMAYCL1PPCAC_05678, partial [Pristionchus mayeri]
TATRLISHSSYRFALGPMLPSVERFRDWCVEESSWREILAGRNRQGDIINAKLAMIVVESGIMLCRPQILLHIYKFDENIAFQVLGVVVNFSTTILIDNEVSALSVVMPRRGSNTPNEEETEDSLKLGLYLAILTI